MPSLLPYLEPNDSKIRIDITGSSSDTAESIPKRFPFRILNESSPLTRLLGAEIISDAGSVVQPVFLLIQKDAYSYQPSEWRPLTNLDVEASWQDAHRFFSIGQSGRTPTGASCHDIIRLGEAAPGDDRNAFQSLFFCNHRRIFFPPPCPGCGQALFLCKDNPLLLSQGLSAYSASLRRYLYCPSCPPSKAGNGFYVLSPNTADSEGVRDCSGLIAAWRYLLAGGLAPVGFPCINCPEREKCHGPENLSGLRIIPFGFYPFHLIVFKAMTIRAIDFLPLVSGASLDDMENRLLKQSGSIQIDSAKLFALSKLRGMLDERELFLFHGTEKHFLEILYLKISFLNDITEIIQRGPAPLDLHAALDCVWVKIPDIGSFLPGLWSFSVGFIDIGFTREAALGHPGAHQRPISYFLGLVWFHVLLTNALQPAAAVIAKLAALFEKNQPDTDIKNDPFFGWGNIFWNPETFRQKEFPPVWKALWEKTLGLAWSLLTIDGPGAVGSSEKFREELSSIRNELKQRLFVENVAPASPAAEVSDDRSIHSILTGIIEKWENAPNPAPAEISRTRDTQAETILFTRAKTEKALLDTEATIESRADIQADLGDFQTIIQPRGTPPETIRETETIILTRDKVEEPLQQTVIVSKDKIEETLVKTVVIPKVKTGATIAESPVSFQEMIEDEPCETIIISGKKTGQPATLPPPSPKVELPEADSKDDILSETIILRSPQK
jgi:hypothetical protein